MFLKKNKFVLKSGREVISSNSRHQFNHAATQFWILDLQESTVELNSLIGGEEISHISRVALIIEAIFNWRPLVSYLRNRAGRSLGFRAEWAVALGLGAVVFRVMRSSVLEVLDAVDRVTNRQIVRTLSPRRAGDPDSLISDNARIKATLPWVPKYADLDLIVQHALAWERKLTEIRGEG